MTTASTVRRRRSTGPLLCACAAAMAAAAAPPAASAQQVTAALLPDSVAERVVAFYNRETTTRMIGDARIGPATTVSGDIAVLTGTLRVEGVVDGNVTVINGHLDVRDGGSIRGRVTVVGGDVRGESGSAVTGGIETFREPLRYRFSDGRIAYVPAELERGLSAGLDLPFGRTDVLAAVHTSYNRVEGLPLAVGPRIRFGGRYPTTARALVIWRSAAASDLDPRRLGYAVGADQLVAPSIGLTLGVRLFSEVVPIEAAGLSSRETGLSTLLLHRDYRDHYEREGWAVHARLQRPGTPYTFAVEYRDEEHESRPVANPFTIFDYGGSWRPQPAVGEGALRHVVAALGYDTRNEDRDPSAGWLARVELERGLGGRLATPGLGPDPPPDEGGTFTRPERTDFAAARVDIRGYARLSPYTRLALRLAAAGSLDGGSLPPQRQHALGGEGSLPGYRLFEFDCGARAGTVDVRGRTLHPGYGCDRMALVQLEYQANFPLARGLAEAIGLGSTVGSLVRWVAFFDAGRAWNEADAPDGRPGGNDDFSADAGLGIRLGPLGAYWAVPLSGRGQGFNFFVRLEPRL
jgi:hypothetical protein